MFGGGGFCFVSSCSPPLSIPSICCCWLALLRGTTEDQNRKEIIATPKVGASRIDSPILGNCSSTKTKGLEKGDAQEKGVRHPSTSRGPLVKSLAKRSCPAEGRVAGPLGYTGPELGLPDTWSDAVLCRGVPPRGIIGEERNSVSLLTASHC